MNADDRRERDRLVKLLRRPMPGELAVKPTTPELMSQITGGLREEYDSGSKQRANVTRLLFDNDNGKDKS